jgi:hypothetical protein
MLAAGAVTPIPNPCFAAFSESGIAPQCLHTEPWGLHSFTACRTFGHARWHISPVAFHTKSDRGTGFLRCYKCFAIGLRSAKKCAEFRIRVIRSTRMLGFSYEGTRCHLLRVYFSVVRRRVVEISSILNIKSPLFDLARTLARHLVDAQYLVVRRSTSHPSCFVRRRLRVRGTRRRARWLLTLRL